MSAGAAGPEAGAVDESRVRRSGAMTVVLSADGREVLLLRRTIPFLWDLPGGGIEPGERPVDAAVRECREETGHDVAIEREVGRYLHASVHGPGDQRTHAFLGRVVGGAPRGFGAETTALRWFAVDRLPRSLEALHRGIIADALAGAGGPLTRRIDFPRWKVRPARLAFRLEHALEAVLRAFERRRG